MEGSSTLLQVLCILLLALCGAHGLNVMFNSSYATLCLPPIGCKFHNSSIWVNNTVPGSNDNAIIVGNSDKRVLVVVTSYVSIYSLTLGYASIAIEDTQLYAKSILLNPYSSYVSKGSSTTQVYANMSVHQSSVELQDNSEFTIAMLNHVNGSLFEMDKSTFAAYDSSYVYIQTTTATIQGTMNVSSTAFFGCLSCLFINSSATIEGLSVIPSLQVIRGNITFTNGLDCLTISVNYGALLTIYNTLYVAGQINTGTSSTIVIRNTTADSFIGNFGGLGCLVGYGNVFISSSNISIYNDVNSTSTAMAFRGSLYLDGAVIIQISYLQIFQLGFSKGFFQEEPNIVMTATGVEFEYLHSNFPGTITVLPTPSNAVYPVPGLTVQKAIKLTGDIICTCCSLYFIQGFASDTALLLNTTAGCTTSLRLQAYLSVPEIYIDEYSTLQITNSTIAGNVINAGTMEISAGGIFYIQGNFQQTVNATLVVNELVNTSTSGPIFVNGSVSLNGYLDYGLANCEEPTYGSKYVLMTVTGNLTGRFRGPPLNSSLQLLGIGITYTDHMVYLGIPSISAPSILYLVVPIGVGVGVVSIACGAIIYYNRRRVKYEPINDAPS